VYDAVMSAPRSLSFDPVVAAREVWVSKGWEEAALGMATITSIMRAHQLFLAQANDALRPFDLTFARYEVLAWLAWNAECGSMSLSQIGELFQVTPATVTNAIDRLEADDLVRRLPHPDDARSTLAEITTRGRRTVAAATAELNAKVFATVRLTDNEMETLLRLLVKVRVEAGDFASAAGNGLAPSPARARSNGARKSS
jgi:DNA-binding MarR family transcriptional regulator